MQSATNRTPSREEAPTRVASLCAGSAILAASTYAIIVKGQQDFATALLTGALSVGILVGAIAVGAALNQGRRNVALAIMGAMICGEAFALLGTGERIVAQREASQAQVRVAAGAYEHARTELAAAQNAHNAAMLAVTTRRQEAVAKADKALSDARAAVSASASQPGCKDRCVTLLNTAVASAEAEHVTATRALKAPLDDDPSIATAALALEQARALRAANPRPEASGSPLADRLGWQPWLLDLLVAGLLSIAANGLAALLISFGAHRHRAESAPDTSTPTQPPARRSRRGATTKDASVVSFVAEYAARHGRPPTLADLRNAFPDRPRQTLSGYLSRPVAA